MLWKTYVEGSGDCQKVSSHPAKGCELKHMKGTSSERTKTIHWLHFVKAINNVTENKKNYILLFSKNVFTSSQKQKGQVESQTKLTF